MKPRKGWRVLRRRGGHLESLFMDRSSRGRGAGVRYIQNEITYPKPGCGPLTVLKTKRAAEFLTEGMVGPPYGLQPSPTVIRKCRYLPSREKEVWTRGEFRFSTSLRALEQINSTILLPNQVALASWVRILPKEKKRK